MVLPRFYPILDTRTLAARGIAPMQAFARLAEVGARIVQLRHKDEWTREIFSLAAEMAEAARKENVTFIVNDRADAALAAGAAGVHLGQTDLTPSQVRSFAGDRLLVGLSTHNETQLRQAASEPADYLALGPIFGTQSKERPDPTVGVDGLRRLRSLTTRPLTVIGGITRGTAPQAWEAGADSCAVIADMLEGDWRESMRQWAELAEGRG
ncbi:MAG: thiamine phosphate synthase [Bryobacterales bacterium]